MQYKLSFLIIQEVSERFYLHHSRSIFLCYFCAFLSFSSVSDRKRWKKLVLMQNQMILTSKWHVEQPFAGWNIQQATLLLPMFLKTTFKYAFTMWAVPYSPNCTGCRTIFFSLVGPNSIDTLATQFFLHLAVLQTLPGLCTATCAVVNQV